MGNNLMKLVQFERIRTLRKGKSSKKSKYKKPMFNCTCCPLIKLPGDTEELPFLVAADEVLSTHFEKGAYLKVSDTKVFPPVLKHVGVSQVGFEAEFTVYNKLSESGLPIYVFHSWKPINSAEETADFLIITSKTVISLEVKAFELVENPATENIETFNKVLMKSLEQQSKVRKDLGKFLSDHGCLVEDIAQLPLITFTLFPTARDRQHHISNIASDFETKLEANVLVDQHTALNFEDRILFSDEYIGKLEEVLRNGNMTGKGQEYQLRTLLSWFYGTYSYQGLRHPSRLELADSYSMDGVLNTAYHKIKSEIAGVFLTQEQDEIIKCNQDFLAIVGLPGTGKTYCLVSKLLEVLKKKMIHYTNITSEEYMDPIFVVHSKKEMLDYMESIIKTSLAKEYTSDDMVKVGRLVKFVTARSLGESADEICKEYQKLTVFFDDCEKEFWQLGITSKIMKNVVFFWYTCYSVIPWLDSLPRPYSQLSLNGDTISELNKYATLGRSVRFTAQIHTFVKSLTESLLNEDGGFIDYYGPRKTASLSYATGTRIVGHEVTFVPLELDFGILEKVNRLEKLSNVKRRKFEQSQSALLSSVKQETSKLQKMFLLEDIWVLTIHPDIKKVLKQGLSEAGSNLNVDFCLDTRGQEKQCVLIVKSNKTVTSEQILFDAATRAVSKVVIIYRKDDEIFSDFVEKVKKKTPEICTAAVKRKAGKTVTSALRIYEPANLSVLLQGDEDLHFEMFTNFSNDLHYIHDPCYSEEDRVAGRVAFCNLSCVEKSIKEIQVASKSGIFQQFQEACHYALVITEVRKCFDKLKTKLAKEPEDESDSEDEFSSDSEDNETKSEDYKRNLHDRMNRCLTSLVDWMMKMKGYPEVTPAVFDSSFLQYKRIFQLVDDELKLLQLQRLPNLFQREETKKLLSHIDDLHVIYCQAESCKETISRAQA